MSEAFLSLGKLLSSAAPSTRSPVGAVWVPPATSAGSARRRAQAQFRCNTARPLNQKAGSPAGNVPLCAARIAGASILAHHQWDKDLIVPGAGEDSGRTPCEPMMECNRSPLDPLEFARLLQASDSADDSLRDGDDGMAVGASEATEDTAAGEGPELSEREARKLRKREVKAARRARREGAVRLKPCDVCQRERDLLVRCTVDESGKWVMVCGTCWRGVSGGVVDGDAAHPHYRYGGLWKAK